MDLTPVKSFFWDTDLAALRVGEHRDFIIGRILECGTLEAVHWLFDHFSEEQIKHAVQTSNILSDRTYRFWVVRLSLDPKERQCTNKLFRLKHKQLWNH